MRPQEIQEKYYKYIKEITNQEYFRVLTDELKLKTQMVAGEDWKHCLRIMGFTKQTIQEL